MNTQPSIEKQDRGNRKERVGVVVSNSCSKTITVEVQNRTPHPLYRKVVKSKKRFVAHDEACAAKVGNTVKIVETRPLSKTKRWRLVEIVGKSEQN